MRKTVKMSFKGKILQEMGSGTELNINDSEKNDTMRCPFREQCTCILP